MAAGGGCSVRCVQIAGRSDGAARRACAHRHIPHGVAWRELDRRRRARPHGGNAYPHLAELIVVSPQDAVANDEDGRFPAGAAVVAVGGSRRTATTAGTTRTRRGGSRAHGPWSAS